MKSQQQTDATTSGRLGVSHVKHPMSSHHPKENPMTTTNPTGAAAEALRSAADDLEALVDAQHPDALNPDQWLRDRADAIEDGGSR